MKELSAVKTRDIARELARKYSTMTHDELDILESVLVPMRFNRGDMIVVSENSAKSAKNALFICCFTFIDVQS